MKVLWARSLALHLRIAWGTWKTAIGKNMADLETILLSEISQEKSGAMVFHSNVGHKTESNKCKHKTNKMS